MPLLMTGAGLHRPVATGYQGPGDLTSGALIWGGTRAYNAAYAVPGTNPAMGLLDQAGANSVTIAIATNGYLDGTAIATWVAAHSVTTIRVTKVYDQTGNAGHAEQLTLAQMPALVLSPTGLTAGRYGLFFSSSRADQLSSSLGNLTASNPSFTISALTNRTTRQVSTRGGVASITGAGVRLGYSSNAGTVYQYAGSALNDFGSITDNAWHGMQGFFSGASSLVNIDGVDTSTNNPGTGALSSTNLIWSQTGGGDAMDGYINELGIWSGSVAAGMGANQLASL